MARRKETTSASVPAKGHPDRKRVLNVLAQQRYRERAREKVKELEAKAATNAATTPDSMPTSSSDGDEKEGGVATINTCAPSLIMSQWRSPNSPNSSTEQSIASPPDWMNIEPNMFPADSSGQWFDLSGSSIDLSAENLQGLETAEYSFADDALLQDPTMKLMTIGNTIASMMHCGSDLWDPTTLRVVDPAIIDPIALPLQLHPVEEQLQLPHHPMFDILPWPQVRRKLIRIFSLPMDMRPPSARDPLALIYFAYDIEDPVEGLRVSGSDGFDGKNWEVGQLVFSKWWWALDSEVIRNSNRLREARGAPRLRLTNS